MTNLSIATFNDAPIEADRACRGSRGLWIFIAIVVVVFAAAPFYLSDAWMSVLGKAYIAALFALAFNLLFGQAGMLSFGHAAYFGIGAFAAIHAMEAVQDGLLWLPTPLMPLTGALAGLAAGAIAGIFASRRSGVYFAMVTLAISELLYTIAPNLQEIFGGESGISSYREPFLIFNYGRESHVYTTIFGWFVLCALLLHLLTRTLFGRLAVALRESETRLPALGFNVYRTKVLLFALSGMFAGIAGALLSITNESANYLTFGVGTSATVVLNTFIGGVSVFLGPAIGAIIMTLFGYFVSDLTRSWLLYQGLIFIALMLLAPRGVASLAIASFDDVSTHGVSGLKRVLTVAVSVALVGFGIVMFVELFSAMFTRDYRVNLERTGELAPIYFLWRMWDPLSVLTWLLPVVSVAAGTLAVRFGVKPRTEATE